MNHQCIQRPGEDSIYVMAVRKEDAGVYTCVAGNSAGSVQASATLRVYGQLERLPIWWEWNACRQFLPLVHISIGREFWGDGDSRLHVWCTEWTEDWVDEERGTVRLPPPLLPNAWSIFRSLVADVILPLRIHNSSNDVHDETIKEEKTPRKSLRANDQIFIILEV